jgi:hypothetical protein
MNREENVILSPSFLGVNSAKNLVVSTRILITF